MTTKALPWKTKRAVSSDQKVEIGHPDYGVLLIEKKGSLTPNEEIEVSNYFLNFANQDSLSQAKIEIATQLLKSRVEPNWTREDTLKEIESFALIEDLYQFHSNERSRWVGQSYVVKTEGSDGYIAASDYARNQGCLVACRPDIAGQWFVFKSRTQVPDGFDIVCDYAKVIESELEESPKKTTQQNKSTGAISTGG
jgi:hypothetical protein